MVDPDADGGDRDREGHGGEDLGRSQREPWEVDTCEVSNDRHFEEALVDVVGLYLNPPARAVVFFSMRNPRARPWTTQPSPPMKPAAGMMTYDYNRNGTIECSRR